MSKSLYVPISCLAVWIICLTQSSTKKSTASSAVLPCVTKSTGRGRSQSHLCFTFPALYPFNQTAHTKLVFLPLSHDFSGIYPFLFNPLSPTSFCTSLIPPLFLCNAVSPRPMKLTDLAAQELVSVMALWYTCESIRQCKSKDRNYHPCITLSSSVSSH